MPLVTPLMRRSRAAAASARRKKDGGGDLSHDSPESTVALAQRKASVAATVSFTTPERCDAMNDVAEGMDVGLEVKAVTSKADAALTSRDIGTPGADSGVAAPRTTTVTPPERSSVNADGDCAAPTGENGGGGNSGHAAKAEADGVGDHAASIATESSPSTASPGLSGGRLSVSPLLRSKKSAAGTDSSIAGLGTCDTGTSSKPILEDPNAESSLVPSVSLQPRKASPSDGEVVPSLCSTTVSGSDSSGIRVKEEVAENASQKEAAKKETGESSEPKLSPVQKFGLRKRKPKPESITCDTSVGVDATSPLQLAHDLDRESPSKADSKASPDADGPISDPSKGPAGSGGAATSPEKRLASSPRGAGHGAPRNVTFSPTPPSYYAADKQRKTPTRSPAPNQNFHNLPSLQDAKLLSPTGILLSPGLSSAVGGRGEDDGEGQTSKPTSTQKEKGGRTTPTNFANDFGKTLQSPFNTDSVFSWLQSPTPGMFSPGGYVSSTNTPRGMYSGLPGTVGPRTPGTPTASSFFFSDVAGLPQSGDFSPKTQVGNKRGGSQPSHPLSNLICVSPLAANKRRDLEHEEESGVQANKPGNYGDVFESPRHTATHGGKHRNEYAAKHPGSVGGSTQSKDNNGEQAPTLDAVHMAERDLMEDEDLGVLLQLASTSTPKGTTPRSRVQHYQYQGHDAPTSLQLPLIGRTAGGSASKLARKGAFRDHPHQRQLDDFRPPTLPVRSNSSGSGSKGSREIMPIGGQHYGAERYMAATKGKATKKKIGTSPGKKLKASKGGKTALQSGRGKKAASPGASKAAAKKKIAAHPASQRQYSNHPGQPTKYPHLPIPGHPPMHMGHNGAPPPRGHPSYGMPPSSSNSSQKRPGSSRGMPAPPPHGVYPHHPHFPPHHMSGNPPHYMLHYPPHPHAPRHPLNLFGSQQTGGKAAAAPKAALKKAQKSKSPKAGTKRPAPTAASQGRSVASPANKKAKKASPKKKKGTKAQSAAASAAALAAMSPVDRQKAAQAIQKVNAASGGKNDKAAALAAAILRGVTMRPSGKWQAQLYYAGKSRYIGVFDTREKAALAYEIAREKLKTTDTKSPGEQSAQSLKETENAVNAARKAAFDGVNEKDPRRTK